MVTIFDFYWYLITAVVGDAWIWVVVAYGCYFIINALMAAVTGNFFNHGWMAAYVKSTKRLDGKTAIVTGANRYCMILPQNGIFLFLFFSFFFFFSFFLS